MVNPILVKFYRQVVRFTVNFKFKYKLNWLKGCYDCDNKGRKVSVWCKLLVSLSLSSSF